MVTTRRAGAATTANSTEDRFVFADFKLIGALGAPGRHDLVRDLIADAAASWQSAADVQYRYVPLADTSCTSSNTGVVFNVIPGDLSLYPARAGSFFPS